MPEIPELEAIRGFLNERLPGQAIVSAEVRIPVVVRTPAADLRASLPGDRFVGVGRHGKVLLLRLESDRVLAINPMLAGRFQLVDGEAKRHARTCVALSLESGDDLRYVDDRVMGKVYLVGADALTSIPTWASGGPDLLDPALDEAAWLAALRRYRGAIKNILVNSAFVQGIGNAYSDEIL